MGRQGLRQQRPFAYALPYLAQNGAKPGAPVRSARRSRAFRIGKPGLDQRAELLIENQKIVRAYPAGAGGLRQPRQQVEMMAHGKYVKSRARRAFGAPPLRTGPFRFAGGRARKRLRLCRQNPSLRMLAPALCELTVKTLAYPFPSLDWARDNNALIECDNGKKAVRGCRSRQTRAGGYR